MLQTDQNGLVVELTLQSLHGVAWRSLPNDGQDVTEPPPVAVSVAFTGSASDMQVSSSTMCGRTGHLVIESDSIHVDSESATMQVHQNVENNESELVDNSNEKICFLVASFHDPSESSRRLSSSHSVPPSISSSGPCNSMCTSYRRPHVMLRLPHRDPEVPKVPLCRSNRDSKFIASATASVVSEAETDFTGGTTGQCSSRGGPSVLWSSLGGAAMPEIVELHVTLRSEEDGTILQEGIAHLVLFSNQGQKIYTATMDLPVKKKTSSTASKASDSAANSNRTPKKAAIILSLETQAHVRVHVSVRPENSASSVSHSSCYNGESLYSPRQIIEEHKIGGILDQLNDHEEMAAARAKAAKLGLQHRHCEEEAKVAEETGGHGCHTRILFCDGLEWRKTLQTFADVMTRCDTSGEQKFYSKKHRKPKGHVTKRFPTPKDSPHGMIRTNSTMLSTIATRESLGI